MNYQKEIELFLLDLQKYLRDDLEKKGRNASGRSSASIKVIDIKPFSGKLIGSEVIRNIFGGRPPSSRGGQRGFSNLGDFEKNIAQWCAIRGIPLGNAKGIMWGIIRSGTKLWRAGAYNNNAIINALQGEKMEVFLSKISGILTTEIIKKIEKNGNKN